MLFYLAALPGRCGRWGSACGLLLALLLALGGGAAAQPAPDHLPRATARQAEFFHLLQRGDSAYARKAGYDSFAEALRYYDQAQALADRSQDTLLLAEAVFARARVYDAWNKQPLQTIEYFQRAAQLLARVPGQRARAHYARYLVAHAYEKVPDSLLAVQTLRQLARELRPLPDSIRRQLTYTVEMALSSTEVHNYALADTLLRQLVYRPGLHNDPTSYDYLTHYYLVQSRLDVYLRRRSQSPFLDSLQQSFRASRTLLDRLYLSQQLARLLADAGRYRAAYEFQGTAVRLGDSLVDGGDLERMRQTLVASEQRAQAEALTAQRSRTSALWGLGGALVVITLLSFYLARQGRRARQQSRHLGTANEELARLNRQLDAQVGKVELLNKEIQHRVKNNLHMIFSLLHMQERGTTNEEVIEQLQTARLRVESIAALHNQLLRNPHGLDLGAYLRTLITAVVACLANDRRVVTHLSTDVLDLPANSYFALSLILNEWVTNSIKYAHTGEGPLEITVSVRAHPAEVCIDYADNGRPLPPGQPLPYPAGPSSGLGTEIIGLLTEQLGATLTTLPDHPYHYEFCLPRK
ncbi:sensor histidine kinase [Hymenobacter sp. ASUV-10]|uniref:histidine kinase n=1 Tax=Hymenobacter aranciens TaxID=3063996 RepID=A0ABT9B9L1_9BACT|nr:sensor histidine kinase [Hymenobacter sp. ASUV-10]MDO7874419.1 sensor histidine kinase [Hymenobacter sp. ASUV-10]